MCFFCSCGGLKFTLLCGLLVEEFIERRFFCNRSICLFAVATEAGRYLLIVLVVIPGHVVDWLFVISLSHIEGHGLKQHYCIYFSSFGSGMEVCKLFAVAGCGVYCGWSCVTFVFNGANHRKDFRSPGPERINLLLLEIWQL